MASNRFPFSTVVLALVLWLPHAGFAAENESAKEFTVAQAALERLKKLEGTWKGEGGTLGGDPSPVVHEFHVSAGGTVVMEIMDPDGEREINVYYVDGDDLLLTHYCGGGNQPTLRLKPTKPGGSELSFDFSSVTNLENPARDRHIHAGKVVFAGPDRIESWWTVYKEGKELAVSKFVLQR